VLIAVTALAVLAWLIGQLKDFKDFRRKPNDHIQLAYKLTLANDLDEARHELELARNSDLAGPPDREARHVELMIAIVARDFDAALRCAEGLTFTLRVPEMIQDPDDARFVFAEAAATVDHYIDTESLFLRALIFLVLDGIADPCLAALLAKEPHPARIAEQIPRELYPLALASVEYKMEHWRQAMAMFDMVVPTSRSGQLVKFLVRSWASYAICSPREAAERFRADTRFLVADSKNWHVEGLPLWLRMWLLKEFDDRRSLVRKVHDESDLDEALTRVSRSLSIK
jgi:hypothetical protein